MANFYNGFPATYQLDYLYPQTTTTAVPQYYAPRSWQQPYQNQQVAPTTQQYPQNAPVQVGGIIWVQGEAGAKSYIVPNGMTVPLWDSENQTIYIKSVDSSGKPSMTILDYVDRNAAVPDKTEKQPEPVAYATLEQFNELNSQVAEIQKKLSDFKPFASNSNTRKGNNHNG